RRLVAHHAVATDLHAKRIEEHHRIHRLERPALPGERLGHDFVGDRADEVGRHLGAVALGQKRLYLAHAHAAGVHRDDALIKVGETAFMFGNQHRSETAVPVARQIDPQGTVVGDDRLAGGTIALVGLTVRLALAWRITQMQLHFGAHRAFTYGLVEGGHQVLDLG